MKGEVRSIDQLSREEYIEVVHKQHLVPDFSKLAVPGKWNIVNTNGTLVFLYKDGDYFLGNIHLPHLLEISSSEDMTAMVIKNDPYLTLIPPVSFDSIFDWPDRAKEIFEKRLNRRKVSTHKRKATA